MGNLCERIKSARRICVRAVTVAGSAIGRKQGKRNKNGNDARDIIDRLNRRSFARLPFEK